MTGSIKFENIKEDVKLDIVEVIQSWADVRGLDEKRVKGRNARNSTLLGLALCNRQHWKFYHPFLLETVTIDCLNHLSLLLLLERTPQYSSLIQTLKFTAPRPMTMEMARASSVKQEPYNTLPSSASSTDRQVNALEAIAERILEKLDRLQTLIIQDSWFVFFRFQSTSLDGRKTLHPVLNTIKKLHVTIGVGKSRQRSLSARHGIFLLMFCPHLRIASLGIAFDALEDGKYLVEYRRVFKGKSKVRELALRVDYVYDSNEKKSWWGLPTEAHKTWKGGDRKSEYLYNFLSVCSSNLVSLELCPQHADETNPGDQSSPSIGCLGGMKDSFKSLRHLRLVEIGPHYFEDPAPAIQQEISLFKNLKILSITSTTLHPLTDNDFILPQSLEVFLLVAYKFHCPGPVREDLFIPEVIVERDLPNIKEVWVPSTPFDLNGKADHVKGELLKGWKKRRTDLENDNLFKGGKVRLIQWQPGDLVGDALKGENCTSTFPWICP